MSQPIASAPIAPQPRLTLALRQRLMELAPKFLIEVSFVPQEERGSHLRLAGPGFRSPHSEVLAENDALFRLLAEICSILTRWVSFNPLEPAEVTLAALSPERIERCASAYRKHITQQLRAAQRAAVTQQAREALSALKDASAPQAPPEQRTTSGTAEPRADSSDLALASAPSPDCAVSALPGAS